MRKTSLNLLVCVFYLIGSTGWADGYSLSANSGNIEAQLDFGLLLKDEIKKTIEVNRTAKDINEWYSSTYFPALLFEKWRKNDLIINSNILCQYFKTLSWNELSIFENEISGNKNLILLKDCKDELIAELNLNFNRELMESNIDLQFYGQEGVDQSSEEEGLNSEIQYRDISKGYKTYTGEVQEMELVLTFDDGPNPYTTPMVVDILKKFKVLVNFFIVGQNAELYPKTLQYVANEGHAIGNHSYDHPNMHKLDIEQAKSQLYRTHQIIFDILGFVDPFVRFPFGNNTNELSSFLKNNNTAEMVWNIDGQDWREGVKYTTILEDTLKQIDNKKKGIVLLHDIHRSTVLLLPKLLIALKQRGYKIVLLQSLDPELRTQHPLLHSSLY